MNKLILILSILCTSLFAQEFNRSEFGGWKELSYGCSTRNYIIAKYSLVKVSCQDYKKGLWIDFYTGDTIKSYKNLDIDHVVPLKNAFESGGNTWTIAQKQAYANDTLRMHLLPVSAHENRSKGDKSPDQYLPPNVNFRVQYCRIWYKEKQVYHLSVTQSELAVLKYYLANEYKNDLKVR